MATINGTSFADNLAGTGGRDTINGRAGNDIITGGAGADTITLGSGRDIAVYTTVSDSPFASNWDLITDFTQGDDRIDLSALLGATDLIWGGRNATANGVWYSMSGTTLSILVDTNGAPTTPEMRIDLQNMATTTVLTVNDFIGVVVHTNAAPVFTSQANWTIPENTTAVGTVTATDADSPTVTYSLISSVDADRFGIDPNTGTLRFVMAPDFERPGDLGADNTYNFTVQASDGSLTTTQAVTVTVANVNEAAPVITSPATFSIPENSTAVGTVTATDADNQAVTYSLVAGVDSTRFTINPGTGALSFVAAPDFEAPTDTGADNVYNFTVQASDGTFNTTQAVAVTVTNVVNETLTGNSAANTLVGAGGNDIITGNAGADTLTGNGGNDIFVYASAQDSPANTNWQTPPDATVPRVWDVITDFTQGSDKIDVSALLGATDLLWAGNTPTGNAVWYVNSGTQTFIYADIDDNPPPDVMIVLQNQGALTLTASDFIGVVGGFTGGGGGSVAAPVITSPATFTIPENGTAVGTVTATDADSPTLAYSLVAGGDAARFTISQGTGALSFVTAPDFEAPADTGADNVYNFTVQASDGTFNTTQAVAVTVTNVVNETLTGNAAANTLVGAAGNDIITGNAGADTLTGNGGNDIFVYASAQDSPANTNWQTPPDAIVPRVWDVITDFTQGSDKIDVSALLGATDLLWAGNTPTGNAVWYVNSGTQTFIYADTDNSAPPEVMIALQNQGALTLTPNDFIGVVGGFTGGGGGAAPVITSPATFSIPENSTAVGTVTATDADNQAVTYSLVAGVDSARFTINPGSGALSFVAAPDFEAPTDTGADNVYNFTVQASDGTLNTTQAVAVTVTNVVNETLTGNSAANTLVGAGGNDIITGNAGADTLTGNGGNDIFVYASAQDSPANTNWQTPPDATVPRVWDVITDFTQGSDKIDVSALLGATDLLWAGNTPTGNAVWYVNSGTQTFIYADIDDNPPPDVMIALQNSGSLTLTANDFIGVVGGFTGGGGGTGAAPVFTSPASFSIPENGTAVGTVTATDADSPMLTYSLVAGVDSARFTISPGTGALAFVTAPDFEAPADTGADNVYNFTVQASDGTHNTTQAVAVTVTNVINEGVPGVITGTAGNDNLVGTAGNDVFDISAGGNDTVTAGSGGDTILAGAAFNAADRIDGGSEIDDTNATDTLVLDGNYAAGVLFTATTLVNVEEIRLTAGNSYNLTTSDATVVAATLAIDGSALLAGNTLTVNASAETEAGAGYTITGGAGNDILTGGAGPDYFDISFGGNDNVNGGAESDTIYAGLALTAADQINGGAGIDTAYLNGDYSAGLTLGATTLINIESIVVQAGNNYSLTMNNAMLTGTQSAMVDGYALDSGNTLTVNASAETDSGTVYTLSGGAGNDSLRGGAGNDLLNGYAGNDILVGGAGNDILTGGAGNDTLTGGLGNDVFNYNVIADRGTTGDTITDFSRSGANGVDALNLHDLLLTFTGYTGSNAFSGGYLQFDTSSGTSTTVRVDTNGGANSYVTLVTLTGTLLQQTDTANYVL